ncbi:UDP-N-acetylmuramoyl-tripeptide--D-alanyl-D-alanine ligase [Bacillus mesophilus]|uniref:UDP-N-acetylmuramoyl-tripeptide--D-alanyl-D-alanine ligase n=1 Tax=Bacillus mesophilus TaxID=1808955 RepID=A0A6M0QC92_9BACI|nr:UDP-N-acetylmuramoyl-tripeptide--D-alanyl-D-alanine ligase [Bacillus mesophilus]MBM7663147.1 UDP-N-acetylmuramoyl-tripeptide--D-alanyl-D-alanine ligase [Bacillus mesophilus]NEY73877.1 UDP-N-acetylmuramoyl-tripeptide--D-alanyl-D-alanine ligase [Bacillus mesophilus]
MITRKLGEIERMISSSELVGDPELTVSGVSINSREDLNGKLFVPIKGERFNGHEFVEDAFKKGAIACLWRSEEPNKPTGVPLVLVDDTLTALQELASSYRNDLALKVVGVTGSNGKTSTKDMIFSVLSTQYKVQKTEGNFNNHYGLPLTILKTKEDTEVLVLEMGMSSRGEIELLSKLSEPDVAVITNIGESHIQDLGSREEIAEAKLEITAGLKKNGSFIYMGDEPLLQERVERYEDIKLIPFGQESTNEYYPIFIKQEANGTSFTTNKASRPFFIPILGRHNVYNALAAIAVGQVFNVSWENTIRGLSQLKMTKMRAEISTGINGSTIINDAYNASPTSMKAAVELLQDLEGYKRKYLVLGDMLELGDQEKMYHQEIGALIDPAKIDFVFTFGELGKWIGEGALPNLSKKRVFSFTDKEKLIETLKNDIADKDVILIKASRGMRLEEVVDSLKSEE